MWPLVSVYLVLGLWFVCVVPPSGAPDQTAHLAYVQHIAEGNGLPVLGESPVLYEAYQPPLFYLLWAPLYRFGSVVGHDIAVSLMRVFCLLCGVAGIVFTGAIAHRVLPERPEWAFLACAYSALLPMHVFINSSINSDNLGEMLCTVALLPLVALPQVQRLTWRSAVATGALIGLAVLSKVTALALGPALLIAVGWRAIPRGSWRADGQWALVAGGAAAAACGWWFARNVVVYGSLLGTDAYLEYFKGAPNLDWFLERGVGLTGYAYVVVSYLFRTYWGLFGNTDIPVSSGLYGLLGLVSVLIAIGAGRFLWGVRHGKHRDADSGGLVVAVSFLGLVLLAHVHYLASLYMSAQVRHWYPAIAPLMLLMAAGTLMWFPARAWRAVRLAVSALLAVYAVVCIVGYVMPAFAAGS
jgi:hypothetical protein